MANPHTCAVPVMLGTGTHYTCPDCGAKWIHHNFPAPNGGVTPSHWAKLPEMPAFAVVVHRASTIMAYPADTREEAESSAAGMAKIADGAVKVGVYELRATAIVSTSVRFEGMRDPGPST